MFPRFGGVGMFELVGFETCSVSLDGPVQPLSVSSRLMLAPVYSHAVYPNTCSTLGLDLDTMAQWILEY